LSEVDGFLESFGDSHKVITYENIYVCKYSHMNSWSESVFQNSQQQIREGD